METIEKIREYESERDFLNEIINNYYTERLRMVTKLCTNYIGKAYKQQNNDDSWSYYKILSQCKDNNDTFYTFVFTLPLVWNFEQRWPDYEVCEIDEIEFLRAVYINTNTLVLDTYTAITEDEFSTKLDEWCNAMKNKLNEYNQD